MSDEGVPLAQTEVTVTVAASPRAVYDHIAKAEGLAFVDGATKDWRGGRAMILLAPDAQGHTRATMLADAPEEPSAAAELQAHMRNELERVGRLVEDRDGPEAAGEVGLDAILEDLEHGPRDAPLADAPD